MKNTRVFISPSQDILEASKFDIISAFNGLELVVYHESSGERELQVYNLTLTVKEMEKMMVETRPCYPTDKLTFSIADLTRDKTIQYQQEMSSLKQSESQGIA